jgi:hypothetical protein
MEACGFQEIKVLPLGYEKMLLLSGFVRNFEGRFEVAKCHVRIPDEVFHATERVASRSSLLKGRITAKY